MQRGVAVLICEALELNFVSVGQREEPVIGGVCHRKPLEHNGVAGQARRQKVVEGRTAWRNGDEHPECIGRGTVDKDYCAPDADAEPQRP